MSDSILNSIKKTLLLSENVNDFDISILMHINSALSTLTQIGVGPSQGFEVENSEQVWSDFIGNDNRLNSVRTYIYLRVRLLFDPPNTSFAIEAIKQEIQQLEWRLNVVREETEWDNPNPPSTPDEDDFDLDGGTP